MIGRAQPAFKQYPARTDQGLAEQTKLAVQANRLFAPDLKIDFQVILQVLSYAG